MRYSHGKVKIILGDDSSQGSLSKPVALCLDENGALYISDVDLFSVLRLDPDSNELKVVAGGGDAEFIEAELSIDTCPAPIDDGCPACSGLLEALAIQAGEGRLYLALPEEHQVRYVEMSTGRIYTLAGVGQAGSEGDGGPAIQAALKGPRGLCRASNGDVFVADTDNNRVRRVSAATGLIETVAGGGRLDPCIFGELHPRESELIRPAHLTLDPAGDLLIGTDRGVLRLSAERGLLSPLLHDTAGCDELTLGVESMACDSLGNLFFTCGFKSCVSMLRQGARAIERIIGSGLIGLGERAPDSAQASDFDLGSPKGLAVGEGVLYVTDTAFSRTFRVVFA